MNIKELMFSDKKVTYYFDASFSYIEKIIEKSSAILLTDNNIYNKHPHLFEGWDTIIINAGENTKQQKTIDEVINQLIQKEATRDTWLIGVGGGVITDITGFVAGIYMRGINTGFIPTTLLAMVDAAVGGKSALDVGVYKNIIGLTKQPSFLLYDYSLLQTLSNEEWSNGFAEIIKHACIKDVTMFEMLETTSIDYFKLNNEALASLVYKNVMLKSAIAQNDELEKGERKLLNFGHTLGHAIETTHQISHGNAISVGMVCAASFSSEISSLQKKSIQRIIALLEKYNLPSAYRFNKEKVFELIKMDKKRTGSNIKFIFISAIGEGFIKELSLIQVKQLIDKHC